MECYEKEARVGGIFNWGEDKNGVYDNVILTISSMLMAFSDFPAKDNVYWTHAERAARVLDGRRAAAHSSRV